MNGDQRCKIAETENKEIGLEYKGYVVSKECVCSDQDGSNDNRVSEAGRLCKRKHQRESTSKNFFKAVYLWLILGTCNCGKRTTGANAWSLRKHTNR